MSAASYGEENARENEPVHPVRWFRVNVARHITHTRIDAIAALIIAVATVFYTVFAYRQWKTMGDQLAEMRSTSEQTAATIAAMKEQAAALRTQLGIMQEGNRISEAASASNFRAWLAPAKFSSVTDLETSASPTVSLYITNIGREPGENVTTTMNLDYGEMSESKVDTDPRAFPVWSKHGDELAWENSCKNAEPTSGDLIYPTAMGWYQYTSTLSNPGIALREVRARRKLLVVWGCIGYRTLGTVHHTSYCAFLRPEPQRPIRDWSFSLCPAGNHSD